VKRYALSLLGVLGAALILVLVPLALPWRALLAWAWAASPMAMVSWLPARIAIRIGEPIAPEELFGERGKTPDDARLRDALANVEAAIQRLTTPA
jgi:hypothetical protein